MDDIDNPADEIEFEEMRKAGRPLAIEVQRFDLGNPPDLGRAFEVAIREQVLDAIRVPVDGVTRSYQRLIVELAAKHKLPAIYAAREFVDKGGLISYGVSYPDLYFRAASYVNKIFKGEKPGDLPVEQPMKFELFINRCLRCGRSSEAPGGGQRHPKMVGLGTSTVQKLANEMRGHSKKMAA